MFPPLEPSQVPDIWFCPVCVSRNWHVPPIMTQPPPTKVNGTTRLPTPPQSGNIGDIEQQNDTSTTEVICLSEPNSGSSAERSGIPEKPTQWKDSQGWRDTQRWKENSSYAPRGYILDPASTDSFIPLYADGPSIPLSTVIKRRVEVSDEGYSVQESTRQIQCSPSISSCIPSTSRGKHRRTGKVAGSKSPPRKRYKYSDVPEDVENALDLIRNHLYSVSQSTKSQDVDERAQVLEQKMKIQEGEMLICRQELQAMKQKLSVEVSNMETVRAENAELRQEVEELRAIAQKKEDQMKNRQHMFRTVVGTEI
jgi:hypothetical protein